MVCTVHVIAISNMACGFGSGVEDLYTPPKAVDTYSQWVRYTVCFVRIRITGVGAATKRIEARVLSSSARMGASVRACGLVAGRGYVG